MRPAEAERTDYFRWRLSCNGPRRGYRRGRRAFRGARSFARACSFAADPAHVFGTSQAASVSGFSIITGAAQREGDLDRTAGWRW
jgi:hypothetical protein